MTAIETVHRKVLTKHPRLGTSSSLRKALAAAATVPRLMPRASSAPTRPATKKSKKGANTKFTYTTIFRDTITKPFHNITKENVDIMDSQSQFRWMNKKGF
jgi:hypothetical protein